MLRARSSPPPLQNLYAQQPQIRLCEHHKQLTGVLGHSSIAQFAKSVLALDHSKLVLDLGTNACFEFLQLFAQRAAVVLGRVGRRDQCGIHLGAGIEHQPPINEVGVEGCKYLLPQVVFFEQVEKAQIGVFIGQAGDPRLEVGKLKLQRNIVQDFFLSLCNAVVKPKIKYGRIMC